VGIGLLVILLFVIAVSGCTVYSKNANGTFSDGSVSFNYPGELHQVDNFKEINSTKMEAIAYFNNDNVVNYFVENKNKQFIQVLKNKSYTTPTEARDKTIIGFNSFSGEVSTKSETNPNGIVVEKIWANVEESGLKTMDYRMFFKINDAVYIIRVYGPESNKQQIINTSNLIFQSIK
jgi:hypothetical protein